MKTLDTYVRKISSEEARNGYIFVLKNRLSFFPRKGKTFEIDDANSKAEVRVESYSCTCQGPDLPHDHFFVRWAGLRRGEKVVISKKAGDDKSYLLKKPR